MNNKQKRLYCFRLFDIATIYCFAKDKINNGMSIVEKMGLSLDDRLVIQNFKSSFSGDNTKRHNMIEMLRKEVLRIIDDKQNSCI